MYVTSYFHSKISLKFPVYCLFSGETHYNAIEQPHVYFQMLFLTGQFELALEFLWRIDKLKVHAVHMAIALHECNLLGIPNCPESPLRKYANTVNDFIHLCLSLNIDNIYYFLFYSMCGPL